MNLYIATNNQHKVDEIKAVLSSDDLNVYSASELDGMPYVDETENTFNGNALLKAKALAAQLVDPNGYVLADDSGLMVNVLGGEPGVCSARYAGENASDDDNCKKLLNAMKSANKQSPYTARFVCSLVMLNCKGELHACEGTSEGEIVFDAKGENGFGYDPIFKPNGFSKTMAELTPGEKNAISHRGNALKKLKQLLSGI